MITIVLAITLLVPCALRVAVAWSEVTADQRRIEALHRGCDLEGRERPREPADRRAAGDRRSFKDPEPPPPAARGPHGPRYAEEAGDWADGLPLGKSPLAS